MGHIAAAVSVIGSLTQGYMGYKAANDEAKMLENQADNRIREGEVKAQLDINDSVAETAALQHQKGIVELNANIAGIKAEDERVAMEQKAKADQATLLLTSDASTNKFSDVFKQQATEDFDKLVDFSFDTSQDTYQSFIQGRELDRQSEYATTQGLAKRDFTLAKFQNQSITLRNQAAAKRSEGTGALITGALGAGTSFASGVSMYGKGGSSGAAKGIFKSFKA